jgi:sugar-specific transcriptional regulator TrmB
MMDNKNGILLSLSRLGLSLDQAKVYVCLLEGGSMSHLQIARLTGVNRTKVYRIVDDLESSSLASIETSDAGKTVIAASPKNLEVKLTTEESKLNNKKAVLAQTLPKLNKIFNKKDDELKFTVNTYEGVSGLKQMLWNELKAKGEIFWVLGRGTIEDLTLVAEIGRKKHQSKNGRC